MARNVEIVIQEVTSAATDTELQAYTANGSIPMMPLCQQMCDGRLDYPPLVSKVPE